MGDSSTFEWKLLPGKDGEDEEENFEAGLYEFNITEAKKLIRATPRPLTEVEIGSYVALLELIVSLGPPIKGRTYDLAFPLIVGTLGNGGLLLLDGWHRVARANKQGLKTLPAVILTKYETSMIKRHV